MDGRRAIDGRGDRPSVRHIETFSSRRSGKSLQIPCWCVIGADHGFDAWSLPVDASAPSTSEVVEAPPSSPSGSAPPSP